MDLNKKEAYSKHYGVNAGIMFSVIALLFGIFVLISVTDLIPRYGITEDMSLQSGMITVFVCVIISSVLVIAISITLRNMGSIAYEGTEITADITEAVRMRRQFLVKIEYELEGQKYKKTIFLTRRADREGKLTKGSVVQAVAVKTDDGKARVILAMFLEKH